MKIDMMHWVGAVGSDVWHELKGAESLPVNELDHLFHKVKSGLADGVSHEAEVVAKAILHALTKFLVKDGEKVVEAEVGVPAAEAEAVVAVADKAVADVVAAVEHKVEAPTA